MIHQQAQNLIQSVELAVKRRGPSDEWTSLQEKYPETYVLVLIEYDDGVVEPMWWTGAYWDGKRRFRERNVTRWKKMTHQS